LKRDFGGTCTTKERCTVSGDSSGRIENENNLWESVMRKFLYGYQNEHEQLQKLALAKILNSNYQQKD